MDNKKMIEIKCENELVQIDIIELVTDKTKWGSDDNIKCNVYFTKFECKFTSKDVVISYGALNHFYVDLKKLLTNETNHCFLNDQKGVIFLKIHKNRDGFSSLRENEDFERLIEFEFFYYANSDMSLSGYLFVNDDSLTQIIKAIENLL